MKLFVAVVCVVVMCSSLGCNNADAAAPSTPASTGGSPEGGECSDDVAVQKKCAAGLVCGPNPKAPVSEHTPGICKKP